MKNIGDKINNKRLHYNRDVDKCEWLIKQGIRPYEVNLRENYIVFETTGRYKKLCKEYDQSIDNQS